MNQCGICWRSLAEITASGIRPVACENSKCCVRYCSGCIQHWFFKQKTERRVCPNCTSSFLVPVSESPRVRRTEQQQVPQFQMYQMVTIVLLLCFNLPLSALINYILFTEALPLLLYDANNAIMIGCFSLGLFLYTIMYALFCAPLFFLTTIRVTHRTQMCISTLMGLLRVFLITDIIADRETRLLLTGVAVVNYTSEYFLIN
jgi:hypothetical protein